MKIIAWIKIIRPAQWLKNLMLYFPPFLGGMLLQPGIALHGAIPFLSFCLASSATYVLNDVLDANRDLSHPLKRHRPIPSGNVPRWGAVVLAACLIVAALILASIVRGKFLLYVITYLLLFTTYSLKLKELPIVDLVCISAGFLLRLEAGGSAFDIQISEWLFLCVFLLSLFLAAGKRLFEKQFLGDNAGSHRKSLDRYPDSFLEGTIYLTGAAVLVTYAIYSIPRQGLVYTVPLCTFGLLRYIFRVNSGQSGDPTDSLLHDLPLSLTGILWALLVGWSIYR